MKEDGKMIAKEIEALIDNYNDQMTNLSIANAVLETIIEAMDDYGKATASLEGALTLFRMVYKMENNIHESLMRLKEEEA